MLSDRARDLFQELLRQCFDPVAQAERATRLAERERTRTDPWRWYCRRCGAEGQADDEQARDLDGDAHVDACPRGRQARIATESHGRLRHVWSRDR